MVRGAAERTEEYRSGFDFNYQIERTQRLSLGDRIRRHKCAERPRPIARVNLSPADMSTRRDWKWDGDEVSAHWVATRQLHGLIHKHEEQQVRSLIRICAHSHLCCAALQRIIFLSFFSTHLKCFKCNLFSICKTTTRFTNNEDAPQRNKSNLFSHDN